MSYRYGYAPWYRDTDFWLDLIAPAFIGFWALVIIYTIVAAIAVASTQSTCLALGYREGTTDYALTRYCVAREDQTDVVVSLEQARQRPRN